MRILIALVMFALLTGCSTKYDTVANKDIAVKVRSIWVDVDYDSRVCDPLPPLPPLPNDGLPPLRRIVE